MNKKMLLIFLCLGLLILTGCIEQVPPGPIVNSLEYQNDSMLILSQPVYDDLRFPASVVNTQGVSNIPGRNVNGFFFDDNTLEQLYIIAQLPHSRKPDSNITAHFHWNTADNTAGDVVWCIEYSWANINDVFDSPKTYCIVDSSELNSNKHLMTSQLWLDGTNKTPSSIIRARLYRNATDVRDTYAADANLMEFDFHYMIDRLGEKSY